MKYATYNEYKPSNIGWIRDFPAHWELKRVKYVANRAEVKVEADEDNPLPYIGLEHVEPWTGRLIDLDDDLVPTGVSNRFVAGDTLFGKLRPYLAKACNVDFDGLCSSELLVLRGKTYDRKFLLYQLLSHGFINLVDSSTYGSKMPRASWDFIGICELPLPPFDEQQVIARFLDAKTAQIDALVAQKRQLIDKLKEKRQALIARTVTRGLPPEAAKAAGLEPNPEMKNSGVVWIGEIPTHWICAKTAFFFSAGMGQTILKEELTDEGLPVYSATEGDHFFGRLMDPKLRLYRGDIVVPARGNSIGHVKLVNEESTTTQTTIYFKNRVPHRIDSEYAFFLMKGLRHHLFEFDQTAIPQITVDQVLGNPVLIPPIDEQLAICKFLKMKETEASDMLQTVEAAIDRLTEYRQALITSAVTGKIDVRELE